MNTNLLAVIKKESYSSDEGVPLLTEYLPKQTHEEFYLKLRAKENRILTDDIVKALPNISKAVPHSDEWSFRKATSDQFCKNLCDQNKMANVLDLGCGNGWFSAKMASHSFIHVIGIDLNLPELKQAQRLFASPNLQFCYGNIFDDIFLEKQFDYVVLNASVQYFPSTSALFNLLFTLLKPSGQIHILDSPFYEANDLEQARKRTSIYYQSMHQPEMINYYFHHSFNSLMPFNPIYTKIKLPFWHKVIKKSIHPFLWVTIKNSLTS
ncbi:class I SAM-dependent methyltransferase [Spirosoma migulaei]